MAKVANELTLASIRACANDDDDAGSATSAKSLNVVMQYSEIVTFQCYLATFNNNVTPQALLLSSQLALQKCIHEKEITR